MSLSFIQNRLDNQARYKKLLQKRAQERARLFTDRKNLTDVQAGTPASVASVTEDVDR